jgi:SAM-dependent methyltransferase
MIESLLDRISQSPRLWNLLRSVVEDGFRGEKMVIASELIPNYQEGPHQRRFLDLGCGTGAFAPCFPAGSYVGVDLSLPYVRFAGRTRRGRFVASDGTRLSLSSECFDAALVLGVLHHLPDPQVHETVGELHRVLRPGATALVMEDIPPPDLWNVAGHVMHWLDRGGFIRTEADYRAFFQTGFQAVRTYHMRSGICDYGVYVLRRV